MRTIETAKIRLSSVLALSVLAGGLVLGACGSGTGGTGGNSGGGGSTSTGGSTGTSSSTSTGGSSSTSTGTTATSGGSSGASASSGGSSGTSATSGGSSGTSMTPGGSSMMTPGTSGGSGGSSSGMTGNSAYKLAAPLPMKPGSEQPGADQNATLTLNLNGGNEVSTVDPQVESFANEIQVSELVFAPLLSLNPKNQVAPNVAKSMNVTNGGKTYTFKLNQTKYSDGKPVTAKDYAYAIRRACDPDINGNYSNIVFSIKGCQNWRLSATNKTPAAQTSQYKQQVYNSIKALDDNTLQIQLQQPAGYFPYVMTTWITYPVRQDLVEKGGKNWWQSPETYIGNGPFKLTNWQQKQQWTFERNDNYFRGKPGIKTIVYKEIQSPQTLFLAYRQKQFDVIGLDPTLLPQVENSSDLKQQLHRKVSASTFWILFNNADPPFNNVKVRQAFVYATDREGFIKKNLNGVGVPADQLLYKGIAGYTPDAAQKYDPQKAKQLLAQAGYPDGKGFPTISLYYDSKDEQFKRDAVFWQQQFKQVLNVNIQPTPIDGSELQGMITRHDPKIKLGIDYGWGEDYPHPQDWLTLVFGNNKNNTNSNAPRGWNNEEYNSLINKADTLPISQAAPMYQKAEQVLSNQAPVSFVFHQEALDLIQPNVKGYVSYPTGIFDMQFNAEKIYKTQG